MPDKQPTEQPERKALRVPYGEQAPDGAYVDGVRVLKPGDDGYDDAFQTALFWHREAGQPMPYAADDDEETQR